MKSVFVTRQIPQVGIDLLHAKGYEVHINPNDRPLTKKELIGFLHARQYDAVLTLLNDVIDRDVLNSSPSVKIFANYTTGFDNFDVEEGKNRGVYLTNVPNNRVNRVAEYVWALLLTLSCRIIEADKFLRNGKYCGWDPMLFQGTRISGKTLGVIGVGSIGTEVATIGSRGFGMRVVYNDIVRNGKLENTCGVIYLPTIEELLKQSDFITVHVPLRDSTHHLISAEHIKLMKPTAFIVNTSRGPVIDEIALVDALKNKRIAGAGLDVYECEPTTAPELDILDNVVLTPHIASSTKEAREEMSEIAALNIIDVLEGGKPRNLVYN
jgi:glyoxylate reductase